MGSTGSFLVSKLGWIKIILYITADPCTIPVYTLASHFWFKFRITSLLLNSRVFNIPYIIYWPTKQTENKCRLPRVSSPVVFNPDSDPTEEQTYKIRNRIRQLKKKQIPFWIRILPNIDLMIFTYYFFIYVLIFYLFLGNIFGKKSSNLQG